MTNEHFIALRKYVMIRLPPMPNIRFIGTSMAGGAIIENLFIIDVHKWRMEQIYAETVFIKP